jgi:hypothetical protein
MPQLTRSRPDYKSSPVRRVKVQCSESEALRGRCSSEFPHGISQARSTLAIPLILFLLGEMKGFHEMNEANVIGGIGQKGFTHFTKELHLGL